MARRKNKKIKNKKLKSLKSKLNVKSGNVPDNTSLKDYLEKEKSIVEEANKLITDADSFGKAWAGGYVKKRMSKEEDKFVKKALRKVKARPIDKARFEARLKAFDFVVNNLEDAYNDSIVGNLTSLLVGEFNRGVKYAGSKKRRKKRKKQT